MTIMLALFVIVVLSDSIYICRPMYSLGRSAKFGIGFCGSSSYRQPDVAEMVYHDDDERSGSRGTRVYVGGLGGEVKKEDLEGEFEKFGKLNNVWVAFNPPGFAFVEFSSQEDAEAACDNLNNSTIFGSKVRVEISRGRGRGGRGGGRGFGGFNRGSRGAGGGMERSGGFRGGRGRGGFGGGGGGSYDRDGDKGGFRGGRGGSRGGGRGRFDDFGGGGRRDFGERSSGGYGGGSRDFDNDRNGFSGQRKSFDSPREFGGRGGGGFGGRGGGRGGGGGGYRGRDYGSEEYSGGGGEYGAGGGSRFRSRSPVGRGSRQAY